MKLAVSADHWFKQKESEKRDKYLDLARELIKQWNMKVTVILTVITVVLVQLPKDWYRDRKTWK